MNVIQFKKAPIGVLGPSVAYMYTMKKAGSLFVLFKEALYINIM